MDGIKRIEVLSSEITDEALLEIVKYLKSREDMNEKYLNEEKNLRQMVDFIMDKAKKISKNNRAIVKDEVVFNWAIHYWDESNKKLNLEKADNEITEEKSKEKVDKVKKTSTKKEWVPEGQLTLFDI